MAEWVYVKDGVILEYHDRLPKSWKDISGLDKADSAFLRNLGWLPVEKNHVFFSDETHKFIKHEYEILSDRVIETLKYEQLTQNEVDEKNENKRQNFWNSVRQQRNDLLRESDWTQVLDIQNLKSEEWIENWKIYRQKLRDLPNNLANENFNEIYWPNKPEQ